MTCPDGRGVIQSEVSFAVSGETVVCGYNDFRGFFCPELGYQLAGWAYSLDSGANFTDGMSLPASAPRFSGDPWLATGRTGEFYYANIWDGGLGLCVSRGTPTGRGVDWAEPTILTDGGLFDKGAIAVDQRSGVVYVSYTRFVTLHGIWLFRLEDDATSFDGPFVVTFDFRADGAFPAVGPGGEVYVAWRVGTHMGFARSDDGGRTFGPIQIVGEVCDFIVPGASRSVPFPQLAVDTTGGPGNGNLYVVWHSACARGSGDVMMSRSTDGGDSWSPALIANDDDSGAVHFFPTVSVDATGRVNVFFYDRRENPDTAITNLYFAQSTDAGQSFNPNIRVTDVPSVWEIIPEGTPNYGDYISSQSIGTRACAGYADGRDGDPDAYFVCVNSP